MTLPSAFGSIHGGIWRKCTVFLKTTVHCSPDSSMVLYLGTPTVRGTYRQHPCFSSERECRKHLLIQSKLGSVKITKNFWNNLDWREREMQINCWVLAALCAPCAVPIHSFSLIKKQTGRCAPPRPSQFCCISAIIQYKEKISEKSQFGKNLA